MADLKISQLTAATTPLAGTEVLPIVQGGTTKQVSVANLTAGRPVAASEVVVTSSTDAYPLLINVTAGSTAGVEFKDPTTTNNPVIASRGNNLAVEAGGNEVFRFGSNNNITMNLGNLIQGTAGKGINFTANTNAPGMTSELLNWYEEGTWTPTDASGAGLTLTTSKTVYTRVGNVVTITGIVIYPSTANASAALIGGLPFTSKTGSTGFFPGVTNASLDIVGNLADGTATFYLSQPQTTNARTNANMSTYLFAFSGSYIAA
jgi:hypothetical protein